MPLSIHLHHIGRRFNRDWIFRNLEYTFTLGGSYAITGVNGAGKSTLLQVIAGALSPSEGAVNYFMDGKKIALGEAFKQVSYAAPYMELVEELTLQEQVAFHFNFKTYSEGLDEAAVLHLLNLPFLNKAIRNFSSGMKQRTKLALAFCSDTPVLLLDEPTSNLDEEGIEWYHRMITRFSANRITIIASNQEQEINFCGARLAVGDFKV